MSGNDPSGAVRDLRILFGAGTTAGLTDGQLLERFLAGRGDAAEAAFGAIVHRHGPMVWGVCRRALNDRHAAADAFQATFLVLVRKADAIRVDDSLGRWLYGVGRKVAARARVVNARRSAREGKSVEAAARASDPEDAELVAILDEEIARLPERYRAAVILCDLGDLSHAEAARQLGCAVGTVGSRLSRGRERLRERLTRRGLAPSTVFTAARTPVGSVPAALAEATARAAAGIAAGEAAAVTATVSALTNKVIQSMFMTQWKSFAAVGLLATSGMIVLASGPATEPAAPPAPAWEGGPNVPETRTPGQVIARMVKTYAEARSYEDEGEVTLVFRGPTGVRTVKRPFSTLFVRPKLYRYEFSERVGDGADDRKRFVIWSDAAPEKSKTWWSIQPKTEETSLAMAIAGGTGISGRSALTAPQLLMSDALQPLPLFSLKDTKLVGEEPVDGAPCDRIEGKNVLGEPETVWLEKATGLVRKIETSMKLPGPTSCQQTTVYRPRIDVEITPDRFAFEPPKP